MVTKVLQLIIVLAWMTISVHCCSCPGIKHPQDQFCKAGHVFYGKVSNEELVPGQNNDVNNNDAIWKYTFKIIFKMKGVSEGVGKKIIIETAGNSARCGVRFTVGQSYILMGDKKPDGTKTIASCDFISQLSNLSPYQSFYLFANGSYSYRRNCNQGCVTIKTSTNSNDCKYDPFESNACLRKKALCRRQGWRCRWVNNGTC